MIKEDRCDSRRGSHELTTCGTNDCTDMDGHEAALKLPAGSQVGGDGFKRLPHCQRLILKNVIEQTNTYFLRDPFQKFVKDCKFQRFDEQCPNSCSPWQLKRERLAQHTHDGNPNPANKYLVSSQEFHRSSECRACCIEPWSWGTHGVHVGDHCGSTICPGIMGRKRFVMTKPTDNTNQRLVSMMCANFSEIDWDHHRAPNELISMVIPATNMPEKGNIKGRFQEHSMDRGTLGSFVWCLSRLLSGVLAGKDASGISSIATDLVDVSDVPLFVLLYRGEV